MIAEQLQAARAAHWRQQQSPLLTLDDAQSWLGHHPLCLYLPRRAQLPAPAPSFVEACLGRTQATPDAAAIEQAGGLLSRLTARDAVVPLNLLGTVGEQPDFLATAEALPFILSLRADADWKHAPQKSSGHKLSPLVLELWKLLEQQGALTATEARETLGRELTEAAVLRALAELWQALRISPVYGEEGQPARWEMMRVRHREALTTAAGTGQVTAISLLVSMYLQSVYAASSEEIEIFLSPVTSRSRVREAVRGLSATRQIHSLSMDAQTYYFLENGLPEFATVAVPAAVEAPPAVRPKRREHPLSAAPGSAAPLPVPARAKGRPEKPAGRAGWKSPQRTPGGDGTAVDRGRVAKPAASPKRPQGRGEPPRRPAEDRGQWRPNQTADPSTPLRSGRDDKGRTARPGGFARGGSAPRPGGGDKARTARPGGFARGGSAPRPGGGDKGRTARPGGFARGGGAPRPGGGDQGRTARPGGFARGGRGPADGRGPWRPKQTADPSTPLRSGRDDKGTVARPGGFARPGAAPRPGGGDKGRTARPGGFARPGAAPRPGGGGQGRPAGAGRAPFKSRSGPPRSGPPRSGPPRSGPPRSGPPRSGPPRSGPPRSGPPRAASQRRPGDFPRRKPDRKKPGA